MAIADGDTVTVLDETQTQHKIRLAGIDAPEKRQPFGNRAKENLAELIFGRDVTVEWFKRDRYGRTVGKIFLGDRDINLQLIADGMAWHYKQYAQEQSLEDRVLYAETEVRSQKVGIGLWADSSPKPPWEWRKGRRD